MALPTASDNAFPKVLLDEQASDIATPASDRWVLYAKSGGIYARNAAGTVIGPFAAGVGGFSATTVRRTTGQLQAVSAAFEAISFDTQDEDTDGAWAIGTPTKIIIPAALNGRRAIFWGIASFDASTAGDYRGLAIFKAATSLTPLAQQLVSDLGTAIGIVLQVQSHVVTLATGDEYTLVQRINNTTIGIVSAGFGFYTAV